MSQSIILFDMDGVLLEQNGYHRALIAAVRRIGAALGAPNAAITENEIERFEAMSVTNEWDSQSIITALILIQLWQQDGSIRYDSDEPRPALTEEAPDIPGFLDRFIDVVADNPGVSAYHMLVNENPWLDADQRAYLELILFNTRDISTSPLLPAYQESVLGSRKFQEHYGFTPKMETKGYLMTEDVRTMDDAHLAAFRQWYAQPGHAAGILTNRPSITPPGYMGSPEAEIGAAFVGLPDLPVMGSGTMAWFAKTQLHVPDYSLFKPHPLHALGLLQLILGQPVEAALQIGQALVDGKADVSDWEALNGSQITVIEDSFKGFACGVAAQKALAGIGIQTDLKLIGITDHTEKREALAAYTDWIVKDINEIAWDLI